MSILPTWDGKPIRVPIPPGRDPFVNTPLISLGPGADGEERFWISTWNSNVGTLAALVTEAGKARMLRFKPPHSGFYSAAQEDADTLWLCGDLSRVVRYTLSTGKLQVFQTGAPPALVFQGMIFDPATGKLFAAAFPYPDTVAFSFDTRTGKTAHIYTRPCEAKYARSSFSNGDGSYSMVLHLPGEALLRWDPRMETLSAQTITPEIDSEDMSRGTTYQIIADDAGRRYIPGRGWYDPLHDVFVDGPQPRQEMTWFAQRGERAWGCNTDGSNLRIGAWDMVTGQVHPVCTIPDAGLHSVNMTQAGKIVAVTLYGEFLRFDGITGALELSRWLPADSIGAVDCLCRIDNDRLLGTPFITQRFWEVNLRTGEGGDCGRAAPGSGEVLQTWNLGGKIYMAAYTGGELTEYDPAQPARFPENPRVVADPPHGMRPIAAADDGRHLYYACSTEYGTLGSTLTRYDTRTGQAQYALNPLPEQAMRSLCYDKTTRALLCGTTMHADCGSCPPNSDTCYFALIDADKLTVRARIAAPAGASWASVLGPLGGGRYLCSADGSDGVRLFTLDVADFRLPDAADRRHMPAGARHAIYAGTPSRFVLHIDDRLELWDLRRDKPLRLLHRPFHGWRFFVQDGSVMFAEQKQVVLLEGCLR